MEVTNLAEFCAEIDKFTASIPDRVVILHRKITLEAFRLIVEKTPVKTGRAKGGWHASIDTPFIGLVEIFDKTPTGEYSAEAKARVRAEIAGLKPYQTTWICNNVFYIVYLEDGWSGQSPQGMVAVTIEELRQMFQ